MSASDPQRLAGAHGWLAWIGIALVAVAIFAVATRRRGALASVVLAGGFAIAAFVSGAALHVPFQSKLRQRLFLASSTLGWLFERKEHVAFGALALSCAAALAALAERMAAPRDDQVAASLRRACVIALSSALVMELLAAVVSIATARRVAF